MSNQIFNSKSLEVFKNRNRAFRILYDTILELNESDIFSAGKMLSKRLKSLAESEGALFLLNKNGQFQVISAEIEGLNSDFVIGNEVPYALDENEKQETSAELVVKESPNRVLEKELQLIDIDTSDWVEYSFPLIQEKAIIGLGIVLVKKEKKLKMKDMVEVFFLMAQSVLCRILNLEELKRSNKRFQGLLENSPMGMMVVNLERKIVEVNGSVEELIGINKEQLLNKQCYNVFCGDGKTYCPIFDGQMASIERVDTIRHRDGHEIPIYKSARPIELDGQTYLIETFIDISDQIKEQKEKEEIQKRLITVARQAGMAEVATSVLHNIGNALNSVNVLVKIITEELNGSRVEKYGQAIGLLTENIDNLQDYLTEDEKGKYVLKYLSSCSNKLVSEKTNLKKSVDELNGYIEHIINTVQMQQSVSRTKGCIEKVKVDEIIDEALLITDRADKKYNGMISKTIDQIPMVEIDRHKMLQILINLINNAMQSVCKARQDNRKIRILVNNRDGGFFEVKVKDNGVGISAENLNKIFTFGFTTKKDGHGFGLHSGSLSAKEMGGSLDVFSEGEGKGAEFILKLPLSTAAIQKEKT